MRYRRNVPSRQRPSSTPTSAESVHCAEERAAEGRGLSLYQSPQDRRGKPGNCADRGGEGHSSGTENSQATTMSGTRITASAVLKYAVRCTVHSRGDHAQKKDLNAESAFSSAPSTKVSLRTSPFQPTS